MSITPEELRSRAIEEVATLEGLLPAHIRGIIEDVPNGIAAKYVKRLERAILADDLLREFRHSGDHQLCDSTHPDTRCDWCKRVDDLLNPKAEVTE